MAYTGKTATAAVISGTNPWNKNNAASVSLSAGTGASCVALQNTLTLAGTGASDWKAAFGQATLEDGLAAWSSWWCSNGLYKSVASGTVGSLNGTQLFLSGSNQRRELARVGCPQKAAFCGNTGAGAI
jgi:hypothetical protein